MNIETLESEFEDIKKQFSHLMKNAIPELKQFNEKLGLLTETLQPQLDGLKAELGGLGTELGGMKAELGSFKTSTTTQLESLSSSLSNFQNTVNPKISTLESSVSSLNGSFSSFQSTTNSKLASLESGLNHLTNTVIPDLESSIGSGGGGEEVWEVLYDKTSSDPKLNWGFPNGINKSAVIDTYAPDLKKYKKLRYVFYCTGDHIVDVFDLSELPGLKVTSLKVLIPFRTANSFIANTITVSYMSGVCKLQFTNFIKMVIVGSKYPTVTIVDNGSDYYYTKIYGLPF